MRTTFKHIVVKPDTYESLKLLGNVPDSFDSVIRRLIESEKHQDRVQKLEKEAATGQTLAGHDPIAVVQRLDREAETT